MPDTAAQQAALADLLNGATRRRLLGAIGATGTLTAGCIAADISQETAYRWMRADAGFAAEVAAAKRAAGERVFSRLVTAALAAEDTALLNHPTAAIMVVNSLLPEYRPNPAPQVAVQVNVSAADFAAALKSYRELAAQPEELLPVPQNVTPAPTELENA